MSAAAAARPLLHCIIQATTTTLIHLCPVVTHQSQNSQRQETKPKFRTLMWWMAIELPESENNFNQFHSRSRDKVHTHTHTILKISNEVEFNTKMERMTKRKLNSRPLRCPPIFHLSGPSQMHCSHAPAYVHHHPNPNVWIALKFGKVMITPKVSSLTRHGSEIFKTFKPQTTTRRATPGAPWRNGHTNCSNQ